MKTWLPVQLVQELDEAVVASSGAYSGRDDFIREAIADRIAEDRMRPNGDAGPLVGLRPDHKDIRKRSDRANGAITLWGSIGSQESTFPHSIENIPTLPVHEARGTLYGLHNRDYPTLWATRSLLTMVAERGAPLPWDEFLHAVVDAAWKVGAHLAKLDAERSGDTMKAAIGFPTNTEKKQSSEARFVEHMLGVPDRRGGPIGPLFALRLAATRRDGDETFVAPTNEGVVVWERLAAGGFAATGRLPHPDGAWRTFRDHIRAALPDDHAGWLSVLRALADRPPREVLVSRFADRWPRSSAETNVGGYVSRGREWGLVAPKLIDGRYALTERGSAEVAEAQ